MIAFAAAGDIFIAGILCTILHSSKTGFSRSNTLINKLVRSIAFYSAHSFSQSLHRQMVFAINTGLLTRYVVASCILLFLLTIAYEASAPAHP